MKKIIFIFLIFFASYNICSAGLEDLDDIFQGNIIDLPDDFFIENFFSTEQDGELEQIKSSIGKEEAIKHSSEKIEKQPPEKLETKEEKKDSDIEIPKPKKNCGKRKKNKNAKPKRDSKRRLAQCPHCDYKKDNYSVNRHIRAIHTKECPFKCDLCGKSWADKSYLFKHKLNVHLVCTKCELKFETREDMLTHKENHHTRKK